MGMHQMNHQIFSERHIYKLNMYIVVWQSGYCDINFISQQRHTVLHCTAMKQFYLKQFCNFCINKNPYKKTRGNIFKLLVPKPKSKIRQNFFTSSIIKHWNLLKSSDINVRRINIFKKNVLRYLAKQKIWW